MSLTRSTPGIPAALRTVGTGPYTTIRKRSCNRLAKHTELSSNGAVCVGIACAVGAAFANGALCLLDARAGAVTGAWYAHDEPLTVAQALGEWGCLTAARDRTMALWDVRALSGSKLQPVQTFHGHKDPVRLELSSLSPISLYTPLHTATRL